MRKIITIAALTLLASSAFAASDIYRWKDANGIWHYSDQPQPGAELVPGGRVPTSVPLPAQAPALPATTSEPFPVSKDVADSVREETASEKAKQCTEFSAQYDSYVKARRIIKTDKDGNRVYMTEAEADAARLQARSNRDLACGS